MQTSLQQKMMSNFDKTSESNTESTSVLNAKNQKLMRNLHLEQKRRKLRERYNLRSCKNSSSDKSSDFQLENTIKDSSDSILEKKTSQLLPENGKISVSRKVTDENFNFSQEVNLRSCQSSASACDKSKDFLIKNKIDLSVSVSEEKTNQLLPVNGKIRVSKKVLDEISLNMCKEIRKMSIKMYSNTHDRLKKNLETLSKNFDSLSISATQFNLSQEKSFLEHGFNPKELRADTKTVGTHVTESEVELMQSDINNSPIIILEQIVSQPNMSMIWPQAMTIVAPEYNIRSNTSLSVYTPSTVLVPPTTVVPWMLDSPHVLVPSSYLKFLPPGNLVTRPITYAMPNNIELASKVRTSSNSVLLNLAMQSDIINNRPINALNQIVSQSNVPMIGSQAMTTITPEYVSNNTSLSVFTPSTVLIPPTTAVPWMFDSPHVLIPSSCLQFLPPESLFARPATYAIPTNTQPKRKV